MALEMTREELDALAVPPREQFGRALEAGAEEAQATFERLDRSYDNFVAGFRTWTATIQAFLLENFGFEALDAGLADEAALAPALRLGLSAEDLEADPDAERERMRGLIESGDRSAAQALFERIEARHRRRHDAWHDRLSSWLSHVYRRHGVEQLELCIRYSGERTLLGWMPRDLERPAAVRVRQWAAMALGNFSRIRVDEDEEKFTLTYQECGSCGRQLRDGCYGPPPKLAIVEEAHPLTWGRGSVPVYRTHVAVMHYLLPLEKIGVPWPVILCPERDEVGECRLLLFKNPERTPPEYARRVEADRTGDARRAVPYSAALRGAGDRTEGDDR